MINSRVNSLNLTSKSLPLDDKELKSITLPLTSPARPMQYENTKHHQQQQQPSPKLIQTLGPMNLLSPTNIQLLIFHQVHLKSPCNQLHNHHSIPV